jgi:hypothetical protein
LPNDTRLRREGGVNLLSASLVTAGAAGAQVEYGTLVTGAGVVMEAVYGAANLSIFTSGIVAASSFPVI